MSKFLLISAAVIAVIFGYHAFHHKPAPAPVATHDDAPPAYVPPTEQYTPPPFTPPAYVPPKAKPVKPAKIAKPKPKAPTRVAPRDDSVTLPPAVQQQTGLRGAISCAVIRSWLGQQQITEEQLESYGEKFHVSPADMAKYRYCLGLPDPSYTK